MLPETVRNYIHDHQSEAVETLSKLIGFPSVATPQPHAGTAKCPRHDLHQL